MYTYWKILAGFAICLPVIAAVPVPNDISPTAMTPSEELELEKNDYWTTAAAVFHIPPPASPAVSSIPSSAATFTPEPPKV